MQCTSSVANSFNGDGRRRQGLSRHAPTYSGTSVKVTHTARWHCNIVKTLIIYNNRGEERWRWRIHSPSPIHVTSYSIYLSYHIKFPQLSSLSYIILFFSSRRRASASHLIINSSITPQKPRTPRALSQWTNSPRQEPPSPSPTTI